MLALVLFSCQSPRSYYSADELSRYRPRAIIDRAKSKCAVLGSDAAVREMFRVTGGYLARNPPKSWKEYKLYLNNYVLRARDFSVSENLWHSAGREEVAIFMSVVNEYEIYCRQMQFEFYQVSSGYVFICEQILGEKMQKKRILLHGTR